MKKCISFLLALALLLSLAGCVYTEPENTADPTDPSGTAAPGGDTAPSDPGVTAPAKPNDPDDPTAPPVSDSPADAIVLTPTDEELAQINAAMGKNVEFTSGRYRYYGTYDGYMILYETVPSGEKQCFTMLGHKFVTTSGVPVLYAIRDGKAWMLRSYYADDCLTQEHLDEIYAIHTSYYSESEYARLEMEGTNTYYTHHDAESEFTADQAKAIDECFYVATGSHLIINDVSVRYYGKYNGYYIVFEETDGPADSPVTIGPFTFHHQKSHTVWVIQYGKALPLAEAYGQGILSFHELEEIYEAHRLYYWKTDDEGYYRFAYTDWEHSDAENRGLAQVYTSLIQGVWQSECYYKEEEGELDSISYSNYYRSFLPDGTGSTYSSDHGDDKYFAKWSIAGATERAILLTVDRYDYYSYTLYYITDPQSEYYQCLAYYEDSDGSYSIYRKISDTPVSAFPQGTQYWNAAVYHMLGTWTYTDEGFSLSYFPVGEFCFNIDGTGYQLLFGTKRSLVWWYGGNSSDVIIQYFIDGSYNPEYLSYQADPDELYYDMLVQSIVGSGGFVLQRKSGAVPMEFVPAQPDGAIPFTNTALDILGAWSVDHYHYEGTTAAGFALGLHFKSDGQAYVTQNGIQYPATWYLTGAGDGWITLNCMWTEGDITFVYDLRYITDSKSEYYHQLIYHASNNYKGILTKVSDFYSTSGGLGIVDAESALDTVLLRLGVSESQTDEWVCEYIPTEDQYLISVNYGDTHYVFRVSGKNAAILSTETYPVTGVTPTSARDYTLRYLGVDLNDVYSLSVSEIDTLNRMNVTVHMEYDSASYTVTLNFYGRVLDYREYQDYYSNKMDGEDIIGWRAARDIALDRKGIQLEDITHLHCSLYRFGNGPDDYSVWLDNESNEWYCAQNGFCSNDFSYPTTAILTLSEITEIALDDLGNDIRQAYMEGDPTIEYQVVYTTGARENKPQFEYHWTMTLDGASYFYRIDAFTGKILEKTA